MDTVKKRELLKLEKRHRFEEIFGFTAPMYLFPLAMGRSAIIDIISLDNMLGNCVPEYDPKKCTYAGQEGISLMVMIQKHFGSEAKKLVDSLA